MADTSTHPTLQDGQAALARAQYERAADIARSLMEAGQVEQATQLLESILERSPKLDLARALYAEQFLRREYWQEGADNFVLALQQASNSQARQRLEVFLADALQRMRRGSLPAALLQRFVDDIGQRTDHATTGETLEMVRAALDRDQSSPLSPRRPAGRKTAASSAAKAKESREQRPSHQSHDQVEASASKATGPFYGTRAVGVATVLGGPVGGSLLIGLNYLRHREGAKAFLSVIAAVGFMAGVVALAFALPDGGEVVSSLVGVVALVGPAMVAEKAQKPFITAQLEAGATEGSTGVAIGVGMAALLVQVGVLCCGAFGLAGSDMDKTYQSVLADGAIGARTFADVAVSASHVCAVTTQGEVLCWIKPDAKEKDQDFGQADPPDASFSAVAASGLSTCGVRSDGGIECWGLIGDNNYPIPPGDYVDVAVGGGHACGLKRSGLVACWGQNHDGQVDAPSKQFSAVAAAEFFSCGIGRDDGQVICWGDDAGGKTDAPEGSFVHIDAKVRRACGVRDDGEVVCWGEDMMSSLSVVERPERRYAQVSVGLLVECGITDTQELTCWGGSEYVEAVPKGRFKRLNIDFDHACAIAKDGQLECWGETPYRSDD